MIIVDGVLKLDTVTMQSIFGALSAYMLIGLMFAAFYGAIDGLSGGVDFFANQQPANIRTYQYFSFTTLTTLGYGDFTAVGSFGRAVAVLEAMTGQVFLATLVARLVSAYRAPARRNPPPGESSGDDSAAPTELTARSSGQTGQGAPADRRVRLRASSGCFCAVRLVLLAAAALVGQDRAEHPQEREDEPNQAKNPVPLTEAEHREGEDQDEINGAKSEIEYVH